jgi:flagellar hook assembly protein FlgD
LDFQGGNAIPVSLDVYDLLGKRIKSLINSDLNVGDYTHSWDGTDDSGNRVASGIYIYQLKFGDQLTSKKLMLIR